MKSSKKISFFTEKFNSKLIFHQEDQSFTCRLCTHLVENVKIVKNKTFMWEEVTFFPYSSLKDEEFFSSSQFQQ